MSNKKAFKYIYGPVYSWRLGNSLGIDLLSQKDKKCNFDCTYCQIGKTNEFTTERKVYVSTKNLLGEINQVIDLEFDFITFSGRGEPTLALNLEEVIVEIKKIGKHKIAVITNGTLLDQPDVVRALTQADVVLAKFDVASEEMLQTINRPAKNVKFGKIIENFISFRKIFKGKLDLQLMFLDDNKNSVKKIIDAVKLIQPDELHINTPLRPCAVKPLTIDEIKKIVEQFENLQDIKIRTVYDEQQKHIKPISEPNTAARRGKEIN
ncbi:radical SAM protein [bacterium]